MTHRVRAIAIMLTALTACAAEARPSATAIELGVPGGGSTTLAATADGVLVVNLWATWCGPCIAEMPMLDDVATTRATEVTVVGVNVGDRADEAAAFAADLGVGYPILTDPDGNLQTALGVTGLPATVLIDDAGEVLDVHQGALTRAELDAAIDGVVQ